MASADVTSLAAAERRTWRALFEDGFDEVFGGIGFLLIAVAFWAPSGSRIPIWAGVAVLLLASERAGKAAKRRIVVPRTGLVRPPRPATVFTRKRMLLLVIGGYALAALIALIQMIEPALPPLFPLVSFAAWVAVFLFRAWKTGYGRYSALAVVPAIAAAMAWPIEEGTVRDLPVLFGSVGLGLIISGAWTLRRYLRTHRLPSAEGLPPPRHDVI